MGYMGQNHGRQEETHHPTHRFRRLFYLNNDLMEQPTWAIHCDLGGRFNVKMSSYQYKKSQCGDKTILRPSYLHNGICYTGKIISLYWIRALPGGVVTSAGLMVTSSDGNIFRVAGQLCGEFTVPGEFPTQRPVTRSFDVFFDLCLNKQFSKQSRGWWFQTLSHPLWGHRNVMWHPTSTVGESSRYWGVKLVLQRVSI